MSFVEDVDRLKVKAHMSGVRTPVLVGVLAVAAAVVVLAVANLMGLADLAGGTPFEIAHSTEESAENAQLTGSESNSNEGGEEAAIAPTETVATIMVHVSGAVNAPGVYELAEGARVQAAIDAAGGFRSDAAGDALNCARVLSDSEQVAVPTVEEAQAAAASGGSSGAGASGGTVSPANAASPLININSATVDELDTLPGVGPSTAEKIVADREKNGAFTSVEDIKRVSGIGDAKYESLKDLICV